VLDARIEALRADIAEAAGEGPEARLVARLRCPRGVDTLTAPALVCEVGEFARFRTAQEFMGFTGLVPSEHSSGETPKQGSITKVGNAHLRRLLIEAAWNANRQVGYQLARGQRGQDPLVIERAWRCQRRLHRRRQRMQARGKLRQKIVVAVARELAGFIWAIATDQPLETS
jgi:transposase